MWRVARRVKRGGPGTPSAARGIPGRSFTPGSLWHETGLDPATLSPGDAVRAKTADLDSTRRHDGLPEQILPSVRLPSGPAAPADPVPHRPAVRTRRTSRPAGSGSVGSADRSWNVRRGGTWTRAGSRRCANGGTSRTGRAPGSSRGGEGGIRTHEVFRLCAFQERRLQPLGHLSGGKGSSAGWRGRSRAILDSTNSKR